MYTYISCYLSFHLIISTTSGAPLVVEIYPPPAPNPPKSLNEKYINRLYVNFCVKDSTVLLIGAAIAGFFLLKKTEQGIASAPGSIISGLTDWAGQTAADIVSLPGNLAPAPVQYVEQLAGRALAASTHPVETGVLMAGGWIPVGGSQRGILPSNEKPANFSSVTGFDLHVSPPINPWTQAKTNPVMVSTNYRNAAPSTNSATINYTPAAPSTAAGLHAPNFSSASGAAVYVAPPSTSTLFSQKYNPYSIFQGMNK